MVQQKITSEEVGEERERILSNQMSLRTQILNCLKKDAYINKKANISQQLECKFIPYEVNS